MPTTLVDPHDGPFISMSTPGSLPPISIVEVDCGPASSRCHNTVPALTRREPTRQLGGPTWAQPRCVEVPPARNDDQLSARDQYRQAAAIPSDVASDVSANSARHPPRHARPRAGAASKRPLTHNRRHHHYVAVWSTRRRCSDTAGSSSSPSLGMRQVRTRRSRGSSSCAGAGRRRRGCERHRERRASLRPAQERRRPVLH
jgi:hypothetical protein